MMMTPSSAPVAATRPTRPGVGASAGAPRVGASLARRRNALLKRARRNGEVRLKVGASSGDTADVSELLDGLNEDGLLRYGGLHSVEGGRELLYFVT